MPPADVWSIGRLLEWTTAYLKDHGADSPRLDAEVLLAEAHRFSRAAHLKPVPMPGGNSAINEPWRMTISYLVDAFGDCSRNLELPLLKEIGVTNGERVSEMISNHRDSPQTSSLGRLFDAVAVLVGLRPRITFEGQAAMELEMLATEKTDSIYPYDWTEAESIIISPKPAG